MTFLLTNDDGIAAPGLAALRELSIGRGAVTVVAPKQEQSGSSHRVTDKTPIRVHQVADREYSVEGTPADCTRVGLLHLEPSCDWLLSGINAGGNLGSDIFMSGTVAAAREASLLGIPAIALSQYRRGRHTINWDRTKGWADRVIDLLLSQPPGRGEIWNVNFPDPEYEGGEPEIVFCPVDPGHHAVEYEQTDDGFVYRGHYQSRHREPDCDVDVCFSGRIAVSRVGHPYEPTR